MKTFVGLTLLLALGLTTLAVAAEDETKTSSFGIGLGVVRPVDSDTRDWLGSTWFAGQVDYTVLTKNNVYVRGSVGYTENSAKYDEYYYSGKETLRNIPVKVTAIMPFKKGEKAAEGQFLPKSYWGVGVSCNFLKYKDKWTEDLPPYDSGTDSENKTKFGLGVLVGASLGKNCRAELGYDWVSDWEDYDPGYLSLSVGYQF